MKHKWYLIISVILTVFVLATAGSVIRAAMISQKAETQALKTQVVQMEAIYKAREETYNQMIGQANQDIARANENVQSLSKEIQMVIAVPVATPVPAPAQLPTGNISTEAAKSTALTVAAPNSELTKNPELVNFEGKPAYEVAFSSGSIYIDASVGDILYNGTLPHEIAKEEAATIAQKYLGGNSPIAQTDKITVNGKILWRSIFVKGHMVYVDTAGQVVYVQMNNPSGG